jgi:hypothetical protein
MRRKHAKSIKSKFNDLMSTHPPLNEAYSDVCVFRLEPTMHQIFMLILDNVQPMTLFH